MSSWRRRAWGQLLTSHLILWACSSLALLFVLLFGFSCGDSRESANPAAPFATDTVLMIVLEGVSPEDLTRYALQSDKMPALAQFAKESTWFDRHWAQNNGTNAAFASLLSGLYSSNHGLGSVLRVGREGLSSEVALISEDLSAAGFDCVASVGTQLFSDEFSGFNQGWSKYACADFMSKAKRRNSEEVVDAVMQDLESRLSKSRPVFGLVEFGTLINGYAPDALIAPALVEHLSEFEGELPALTDLLDACRSGAFGAAGEVRRHVIRRRGHPVREAFDAATIQARFQYLDEQLARLFGVLAAHDRYADALIVVTGNVGGGRRGGGAGSPVAQFNLERVRVPLVLRLPGGTHTQAVQMLTQAIDVGPTILGALGLEGHEADGVSLLPTIVDRNRAMPPHEFVLFEDSLLGVVGALDEFWLVHNNGGLVHAALDDNRNELQGNGLPPVPKAALERTRSGLKAFMSEAHILVELAPGGQAEYMVSAGRISGAWTGGMTKGENTREATLRLGAPHRTEPERLDRQNSHLRFVVATGESEPAPVGFQLRADQDAPDFSLTITSSTGFLDESKILLGDRDLAHLALPRMLSASGGEWPEDSGGNPVDPIVDITRESGRWLNLQVAGEAGSKVQVLIAGEPMGDPEWSKLKLRGFDGYKFRRVPGRPDCAWIDGETPLSVSFEVRSAQEFGLSVAIEGTQVSVADMRFLGKQACGPDRISVAVMDWLPGIREHLEANLSASPLDPDMLRLSCLSNRKYANDTLITDERVRDKVRALGFFH